MSHYRGRRKSPHGGGTVELMNSLIPSSGIGLRSGDFYEVVDPFTGVTTVYYWRGDALKWVLEGLGGGAIAVDKNMELTEAHNGKTMVFLGAYTLTIPQGMPYGFSCACLPKLGNATIATSGPTINGGSSPIVRTVDPNKLFAIVCISTTVPVTEFVVSGS